MKTTHFILAATVSVMVACGRPASQNVSELEIAGIEATKKDPVVVLTPKAEKVTKEDKCARVAVKASVDWIVKEFSSVPEKLEVSWILVNKKQREYVVFIPYSGYTVKTRPAGDSCTAISVTRKIANPSRP